MAGIYLSDVVIMMESFGAPSSLLLYSLPCSTEDDSSFNSSSLSSLNVRKPRRRFCGTLKKIVLFTAKAMGSSPDLSAIGMKRL